MSDVTFHCFDRDELIDELVKLGRDVAPSDVAAIVGAGLAPVVRGQGRRFPVFTLVQWVDAAPSVAADATGELRERAAALGAALDGSPAGLSRAHKELRVALARRAVLGELHRMLPVIEGSALETLRGDARLEWRIRASLHELARALAADHAVAPAPEPSDRPARRAHPTMMTGAPRIQGDEAPAAGEEATLRIAPPPEPYRPGPDDRHPPRYARRGDARDGLEADGDVPRAPAARPATPPLSELSGLAAFSSGDRHAEPHVSRAPGEISPPRDPVASRSLGRVPRLSPASEAPEDDLIVTGVRASVVAGIPDVEAGDEVTEHFSGAPQDTRWENLLDPAATRLPPGGLPDWSVDELRVEPPRRERGTVQVTPASEPLAWPELPEVEPDLTDASTAFLGDQWADRSAKRRPHSQAAPALVAPVAARDRQAHPTVRADAAPTHQEALADRSRFNPLSPPSVPAIGASAAALSVDLHGVGAAASRPARPPRADVPPAGVMPGAVAAGGPSPAGGAADARRASHAAPVSPNPAGLARPRGDAPASAERPRAAEPTAVEPAVRGPINIADASPATQSLDSAGRAPQLPLRKAVADVATRDVEPVPAPRPRVDGRERPQQDADPDRRPRREEQPAVQPSPSAPRASRAAPVPPRASAPLDVGGRPGAGPDELLVATAARARPTAQPGAQPERQAPAPPAPLPAGPDTARSVPSSSLDSIAAPRTRKLAPVLPDVSDFERVSDAQAGPTTATFAQLPLRRRAPDSEQVDVVSLGRSPAAHIERIRERLTVDPADRNAQDEAIALLASSDRAIAREAWKIVEAPLRADDERARALYGALVVMADRDPETARKVQWRIDAAQVAEFRLNEPRPAFELLLDALRDDPENTDALERVVRVARGNGWWEPLVSTLEAAARSRPQKEGLVRLCRIAGDLARKELRAPDRALQIYAIPLERGIYEADLVATSIDLHAQAGDHPALLVMLLRAAELASPNEQERLTRAADLCVEEMHDKQRALAIHESMLRADVSPAIRARFIALARQHGASQRALDALTSHIPEPGARALERARLARVEFHDEAAEAAALETALEHATVDTVEHGLHLADALRRRGETAREIAVLERLLAAARSTEEYAAVVRRLGGAFAARAGGAGDAIELYMEAMRKQRYDEKIVHALASLLRADGRIEDLVRVYGRAAAQAPSVEQKRAYLRSVARVAADLIADDDAALELLERAADASDRDPEVMLRLAERCRRVGDDLSELGAMQAAVANAEGAVAPTTLVRLAELELARPRGATAAADLLARALETESLPADVDQSIGRILPRVAGDAGRPDLHLTWLQRLLRRAVSPQDRLVLLRSILRLQEETAADPASRVQAAEAALAAAQDMGLGARDLAPLRLAAARAKMAVGHWNSAIEYAGQAVRAVVDVDPASQDAAAAQRVLASLAEVAVDATPALEHLAYAASTGIADLMVTYADACVASRDWQRARSAIPRALAVADDPLVAERLEAALHDAERHA